MRRPRLVFPLDSLTVDRSSPEPLHRQIYHALAGMIRNRTLPAGTQLPSTRQLATDLGVGRNTIITAVEQLVTEGFLINRPGARPAVVDLPPQPGKSGPVAQSSAMRFSAAGERLLGQPVHYGEPGKFAFHPGMPDPHYFPFGIWAKLLSRRASHARESLFGTYHVTGLPELRKVLADYLASARGVRCTPEQIVVTTGAQAAFDLIARLLLDPGDSVWMEEPGYYGAKAAFQVAGGALKPLPVDSDGWKLDRPDQAPRLVYVTPACQHPLGITMRMEQRLRLLEMCEQFGSWIIEDDFDGEYRFQGRPVPAMQSMDRSGRVIYVGTFAKLLFPALRLGFFVVPENVVDRIAHALSTTGQFAPLLLQAALADFISEGHMSLHLRRMRRLYVERRQLFYDMCTEHLRPYMDLLPSEAGIQVVARLRDGLNDITVTEAAAQAGVNVSPLSKYFFQQTAPLQGLVLGYAACSKSETEIAIRKLERAFRGLDGAAG